MEENQKNKATQTLQIETKKDVKVYEARESESSNKVNSDWCSINPENLRYSSLLNVFIRQLLFKFISVKEKKLYKFYKTDVFLDQ